MVVEGVERSWTLWDSSGRRDRWWRGGCLCGGWRGRLLDELSAETHNVMM